MSDSRMVDAVNGLVGQLLAGRGEVFLPGVGALYTERRPARRVSKSTVEPPCRVVVFSSQQRGSSFIGEIAVAAKVDPIRAEEIYRTWLARVLKDEVLTLEGIGELKFKHFTLAPEFDARLNPQGHELVKIKRARRFDWALWTGIAAIVFAAVAGGYQFLEMYPDAPESSLAAQTTGPAAPKIDPKIPVLPDSLFAGIAQKLPEMQPEKPEPADSVLPTPTPTPQADAGREMPLLLLSLESGRRYVVLGVFSSSENAVRAIEAAQKEVPSVHCRIYRFGAKFLVSPFESDESAACEEFIRDNRSRLSGIWTYTAR